MSITAKYSYLTHAQVHKRRNNRSNQKLQISVPINTYLPQYASVKQYCPPIYDQGQLGSCTSNAMVFSYQTLANKLKTPDATWDPSRLWFYYWERVVENPNITPSQLPDSGGDVVDGLGYVQKNGICSESLFPYVMQNFDNAPTQAAIDDAKNHKIKGYNTLTIDENILNSIKTVIASGKPVLFAIAVYNSFESDDVAQTGMVPVPTPLNYNDPNDILDPYLGGHEIACVGYNDAQQLFTIANSWGANWGDKGFCYIPYAYISNPNLGLEFTVINM